MGGFSAAGILRLLFPVYQPQNQGGEGYQARARAPEPGEELCQGVRHLLLGFDVVGLEAFHVYGQFRHLQRLRGAEHQRVSVQKHRDVRQFIGAAHERGKGEGGLYIITGRAFLPFGNPGGIQLPSAQEYQRRIFFQLEFRQGQRGVLRDVFQHHAITQLVCDEYGIPLLQGLQEGFSGVFAQPFGPGHETGAHKGGYQNNQSFHLLWNKAMRLRT